MNKRRFFYSLSMILLLIVAVAGWSATNYLSNKARQEIIGESRASALTISIHVSSTLTYLKGAVKSLAGSPWIAPALLSKRAQDIERANSALDRYNSALNASVSYLMDAEGMTVASSNRKDPDSFVGKSYRFRPYFQEAAKGQPGRYFALGITSGKRGFYASYPVQNLLGNVVGVVTMKKDLDDMETFFSKYPFCFLISPDGIIFLSSSPAMVLKSLWPLDKAAQGKLIASQQFGNKPFEAVMKKEFADGAEVTLEGTGYFVSRAVIDSDGWSIVLLTPTAHIRIYNLIGILATIGACSLIMFFSGLIYVTDRSQEAIRQSEERYRAVVENARDMIFRTDANGYFTFVNPEVIRITGYEEEELIGKQYTIMFRPDMRDKALKFFGRQFVKGIQNTYSEYPILTKDGQELWVGQNTQLIVEDGNVTGFQVVARDITERKLAEEVLQESEFRTRAITDSAQDAILMMDPEGRISYWNPAAERILGYTRAEAVGQILHALIVPSRYHEAHHAAFPVFQQKGRGAAVGKTLDLEARRKDGKEISVQLSLSAIQMKGAWHAVGVLRDITERKRMVEALEKSEAMLNEMGAIAKVGGWEFDAESQKQVWTKEVYRIHEVDESYEPTVSKGIEFYVPESRSAIESAVQRAIDYGEPFDVELEIITAKGNHRWVHANGNVQQESGITKIVYGTFQDITERKQTDEKIRQMAYHDSLTGLPNRKLFSDRLGIALAQAQRSQKKVGIAMLDLDNFKGVNDTLGHDIGDLLLKVAAERLSAALRKGDTVARFGGDEFVLILPDLKAIEDAIQVVQKIVDSFCKPFLIDTHQLVVTTSIGIAVYPNDGTDGDSLLKNADIAMYQAKQAGRARYQLYKKT
jgi:diguanylate cyclase (GGDEF)-like protein/PAS domain S-box-containing protein